MLTDNTPCIGYGYAGYAGKRPSTCSRSCTAKIFPNLTLRSKSTLAPPGSRRPRSIITVRLVLIFGTSLLCPLSPSASSPYTSHIFNHRPLLLSVCDADSPTIPLHHPFLISSSGNPHARRRRRGHDLDRHAPRRRTERRVLCRSSAVFDCEWEVSGGGVVIYVGEGRAITSVFENAGSTRYSVLGIVEVCRVAGYV